MYILLPYLIVPRFLFRSLCWRPKPPCLRWKSKKLYNILPCSEEANINSMVHRSINTHNRRPKRHILRKCFHFHFSCIPLVRSIVRCHSWMRCYTIHSPNGPLSGVRTVLVAVGYVCIVDGFVLRSKFSSTRKWFHFIDCQYCHRMFVVLASRHGTLHIGQHIP